MAQIPAVMFLEMAADMLPKVAQAVRDDQQQELTEFGDVRAQGLGATGLSKDMRIGYELGLQVARVMLFGNVELAKAGIKAEDLL